MGAVEEPQGDELVPELLVVADGGGGVPGFGAHGGVQAGVLGAQGDGPGFAAGDFVGQDELEEVGVGHVLLAGQGEAFGQGGGELAEFESAQGGGEVGADRVGQRRHGVVLPVTGGWARAGAAPALGWGQGWPPAVVLAALAGAGRVMAGAAGSASPLPLVAVLSWAARRRWRS